MAFGGIGLEDLRTCINRIIRYMALILLFICSLRLEARAREFLEFIPQNAEVLPAATCLEVHFIGFLIEICAPALRASHPVSLRASSLPTVEPPSPQDTGTRQR